MQIKYHITGDETGIAEVLPGQDIIKDHNDILDIMAEAGYNNCSGIIIHEKALNPEFFDLKTGIAGDILQKFSNYRMRLAVIGDFQKFGSKSLKDFIRESNNRGIINFTGSFDEALTRLRRK